MFALRIEFHDGVTAPEMIFIRRGDAIVGASSAAYVALEGLSPSIGEFRIVRGIGTEFYTISTSPRANTNLQKIEGVYEGVISLTLGEVITTIWSLDTDLLVRYGEPQDQSAINTLRRAICKRVDMFPCLALVGEAVSFFPINMEMPLLAGRSRRCTLRSDLSGLGTEHAEFSYSEESFWVAPLEGAGGVTVKGQTLRQGRHSFQPGEEVSLVPGASVFGLNGFDDLEELRTRLVSYKPMTDRQIYPVIYARGPGIKGLQKYEFNRISRFVVGRDPASDIWIQAAHVSSYHLEITLDALGVVKVVDASTNGTYLGDTRMERGVPVEFSNGPAVLDLQMGFEICICFSDKDEMSIGKAVEQRVIPEVTGEGLLEIPYSIAEKALGFYDDRQQEREEKEKEDVFLEEYPIESESKISKTNIEGSVANTTFGRGESRISPIGMRAVAERQRDIVKERGTRRESPRVVGTDVEHDAYRLQPVELEAPPRMSWRVRVLFGLALFLLLGTCIFVILALLTN